MLMGGQVVHAEVAPEAPDVLVKGITTEVVAIIKADKDIQAGDTRKIVALVETKILPHFNFTRMTQSAVGAAWRRATPDQQKQLTQEFRTLLVRTYSASLETLKGSEMDFRPVNLAPNDKRAVVKGLVKRPGMQPLAFEMAVEKQPEGWRVYDLAIENLSLVTNYRSDFGNVVQRDGVNGLIKSLAERNGSAASSK
jgi:phospholipid transport system substrate-binding protein